MLRTIFLLALMVATVSAGLLDKTCGGSDGKCCTASCPFGWTGFKGHCYFVSFDQNTFQESQRVCAASRGNLVSINNEDEREFVKTQIATFVKGCPTPTSKLKKDDTNPLCYWISGEKLTKPCAEKFCNKYGGELVSVPDSETLEHINCGYPFESDDGLWTSITYDTSTMTWKDIDGNDIDGANLFWNSAGGQPNDPASQPCMLVKNNLFHDAACDVLAYALCQKEPDTSTWIGVVDTRVEGTYTNLQGEVIDSSDYEFAGSEPDEGGPADCVSYQLEGGDYAWGDNDCHKYNSFICELDPDCLS